MEWILVLIIASYALEFIPGGASVRIMLPIDMKKPKVAPDPTMYVPSIRNGPCVPAPYLMMLKPPGTVSNVDHDMKCSLCTEQETHD